MSFEFLKGFFKDALSGCLGSLLFETIKTSCNLQNIISDCFPVEKISNSFSIDSPPKVEKDLIHRKTDVKKLAKLLSKHQIVWICSIAGMGKTTLAMEYAQKRCLKCKKIYWLQWKGSLQDTLKSIYKKDGSDFQTAYKDMIFYLRKKVSRHSLLIIDDLNEYSAEEIETIKTFRCKLLITTRRHSSHHVEYQLMELKTCQCKKLFENKAKIKVSNQQLQELLNLTGNHTLAIKLMACYAQEYSLEKLFSDILNGDISNLQNKIETEDGEPPCSIIAYFTKIYAIACSLPLKNLLMNLALLPPSDLKIANIKNMIGNKVDDDNFEELVSGLKRLGWLVSRRDGTIYLHPILSSTIRQICRDENDPSVFQNMLDNVCQLSSPTLDEFDNYDCLSSYLKYYESIIHYYHWKDCYIAQLVINVASIQYIQDGNLRLPLECVESACSILKKSFETSMTESAKRQYARALSDISKFYYKSSCQKAIEIEEEALRIKKDLPDCSQNATDTDKTLDLLKSYSNLMLYYHCLDSADAYIYAKDIITNYGMIITKYKRTQANIFIHYALLLITYGQKKKGPICSKVILKESITYLKKALEVLKKNNAKEHYMCPLLINSLGAAYGMLLKCDQDKEKAEHLTEREKSNYSKKALRYLYIAYRIKKKNHHKPTSSTAISLHNLATTHFYLNHNWRALFYEIKALKIRRDIIKNGTNEKDYLASSLLLLSSIFVKYYHKYHLDYFKKQGFEYIYEAQKIYSEIEKKDDLKRCQAIIDELKTSSKNKN